MNASLTAACFLAPALLANSLAATTFVANPSQTESFPAEPIRVVGAGPGFSPQKSRAEPAAERRQAAVASQAQRAAARPAAEARTTAAANQLESSLRYVFYCFGPVFGNDGREVDPNYMPAPTTEYRHLRRPTVTPVRYTRLPSEPAEVTTWVGADGSRISYHSRNSGPPERAAQDAAVNENTSQSVAEIIAENRRELTKISWARTYRRYPELEQPDGSARMAFEAYVAGRRAGGGEADLFENPMWPETLSSEFMTDWNWRKAEAESWERVRSRVGAFEDVENPYTRRFLEFTAGLRGNPRDATIFQRPTWPERALELHDERLGPVPQDSR